MLQFSLGFTFLFSVHSNNFSCNQGLHRYTYIGFIYIALLLEILACILVSQIVLSSAIAYSFLVSRVACRKFSFKLYVFSLSRFIVLSMVLLLFLSCFCSAYKVFLELNILKMWRKQSITCSHSYSVPVKLFLWKKYIYRTLWKLSE